MSRIVILHSFHRVTPIVLESTRHSGSLLGQDSSEERVVIDVPRLVGKSVSRGGPRGTSGAFFSGELFHGSPSALRGSDKVVMATPLAVKLL